MALHHDEGLLDRAIAALASGGVVAVPTETVYGLAVRPDLKDAVERLFALKGRPENKAISLLVPDLETAALAVELPEAMTGLRTLAAACWPGPLTVVLPAREDFVQFVDAGTGKLGVRVPAHPLTLELLRRVGHPLAVPSANPSGKPSATEAATVAEYFGDRLDVLLDGGRCDGGVESTVVDLSVVPPRVLRQGALPRRVLQEHLGSLAPPDDAEQNLVSASVTSSTILLVVGALELSAEDRQSFHDVLELKVTSGSEAARELHQWLRSLPPEYLQRSVWALSSRIDESRQGPGIRTILRRYAGQPWRP